jgi:hypothetical protein
MRRSWLRPALNKVELFFGHTLSVGVSAIFAEAHRAIVFEPNSATGIKSPDIDFKSYTGAVSLGLQVQLPKRFFVGLSATTPMAFAGDLRVNAAALPGFYQEVLVPWKLNFGIGWIPNRFFQAGLSAHVLGLSPRAARVSDENIRVGEFATLQPRLGISYRMVEYTDLILETSLGSYLEFPRISGSGPRPHLTIDIEIKPWIFGGGFALDYAPGYTNFLISVGVDVGRMLQKMEIFPRTWIPLGAGEFPPPFHYRDEGLTHPINPSWKPEHAAPNVFKVIEQIPRRLEDKIDKVKEDGPRQIIDTQMRTDQPAPENMVAPVKREKH